MTGGGSYKYEENIREFFPNSKLIQVQEFDSLKFGLNFMINYSLNNFFKLEQQDNSLNNQSDNLVKKYISTSKNKNILDAIYVQIGSGVGYFFVDQNGEMKRVQGTCVGGNFFTGLTQCIKKQNELPVFPIIENLTLEKIENISNEIEDFNDEVMQNPDHSISNDKIIENIFCVEVESLFQTAINLSIIHNVNNIIFGGGFLNKNKKPAQMIFDYINLNQRKAYFMEMEEYIGSVGCFSKGYKEFQSKLQ